MSWILHLSDPHLDDISSGQALDDAKEIFEAPEEDLETTQRVFRRTLEALGGFVAEYGKPEVAVVSGDLTYRARAGGFAAFGQLLGERADILPDDRERIVIVPGNHDVDWDAEPSTRERYRGFLGATRDLGCATPLIDGIDFDASTGQLLSEASRVPHVLVTDDAVVVPINSSNYCGVVTAPRGAMSEDEWRRALEPTGGARDSLMAQLRSLRQRDIARVSRVQIEALGRHFDELRIPRSHPHDNRLRVAVLHHQLLPVSTAEERKPYESLVNLGLVRQVLREYGFNLVLHGHKHESSAYWDCLGASHLSASLRGILVISSPGHFGIGTPVMRAIVMKGSPRARNVQIFTFRGADAYQGTAEHDGGELVPLWRDVEGAEALKERLIAAPTVHVAYARLRAMFEVYGYRQLRNVVCEVGSPTDAGGLPPDYPNVAVEDANAWFAGLVGWWQQERSELVSLGLAPFNHGDRIYRRWGDQVDRAVRMLNERRESSRAIIQLVAPDETGRYDRDHRPRNPGSFPAFVLAEFAVIESEGDRRLDCFGYFRKHEMQYWWPVNVAELALLQENVRGRLRPKVNRGRIVTFSAIALWGDALPRVAVPVVDLLVEDPDRLWDMAAAVAFPAKGAPKALTDWREVLRDLEGTGRTGPPKVSAGVNTLYSHVQRFASIAPTDELHRIVSALRRLSSTYTQHADRVELPPEAGDAVRQEVAELKAAVGVVQPTVVP